jgi:hypothetical protein
MTVRIKQRVLSIAAAFPLLWLASVYLYILRIRVHLGHWPSASDGMAKHMAFGLVHHDLAVDISLVSPLILLGLGISAFICRRRDHRFKIWVPIAVFVGSILLSFAVMAKDPGGFILWFAD